MLRRFAICISLFAVVLLAASCTKKTPSLTLLVWEGYADPSFVRGFEEKYHCKVSATYMGSSDELVSKLRPARRLLGRLPRRLDCPDGRPLRALEIH